MPQTLFPAMPVEPAVTRNTGKAGAGDTGKPEDSRFEQLSRAERKRMDQSPASAEPADEQVSPDPRPASSGPDQETAAERETAKQFPDPDPEPAYSPVTFIALQLDSPGTDGKGLLPGQLVAVSGVSPGTVAPGTAGDYADTLLQQMADLQQMTDTGTDTDPATIRLTELTDSLVRQGTAAGNRQPVGIMTPLQGYTTSVELPVGHAQWGEQVVGNLTWLTARNLSEAEIHLTPPDMGPLEVKVRVQHDQASITVHAANPVVRDQLELHSHRLRDMLEQQGLSLDHFDVSDQPGSQSGGEQAQEGAGQALAGAAGSVTEEAEAALVGGSLDLGWKGEVDVFA